MAHRLLIVDDEKNIREGVSEYFEAEGYETLTAENGLEALSKIRHNDVDLIITDLKMIGLSGTELMDEVQKIDSNIPFIVLTAYASVENAVECMRKGAYHYLTKPVNMKEMLILVKRALSYSALEKENESLHHQLKNRYGISNILGHSRAMETVFDMVKTVAPAKANVLITGESGTGKELVANAIHALSARSKNPFVKVHCAALAPGLLESELFGHEKGSFTGAVRMRRGRFELANQGSIFLDEIGEIDASIQLKLLRVLQEREFERVGGEETIKVDTRIITATNADLLQLVKQGKFREDLYYRLKVVKILVPPLRERVADIPVLVASFLKEFCRENNKDVKKIDQKAMRAFEHYQWPGNVRELKNLVENLVVMTKGNIIYNSDLPNYIRQEKMPDEIVLDPGRKMSEYEVDIIRHTLSATDGNKSKAAEILGMGRRTLHRKLEQLEEESIL